MSFNVNPPDMVYVWSPEEELEIATEQKDYKPFKLKVVALSGDLARSYKSRLANVIKQEDKTVVRAKKQKGAQEVTTTTTTDFVLWRDTQVEFAKKIIKSATNFTVPMPNKQKAAVTYPSYDTERGVLIQEWCEDPEVLEVVIGFLKPEWLSELMNYVEEASYLNETEKKS